MERGNVDREPLAVRTFVRRLGVARDGIAGAAPYAGLLSPFRGVLSFGGASYRSSNPPLSYLVLRPLLVRDDPTTSDSRRDTPTPTVPSGSGLFEPARLVDRSPTRHVVERTVRETVRGRSGPGRDVRDGRPTDHQSTSTSAGERRRRSDETVGEPFDGLRVTEVLQDGSPPARSDSERTAGSRPWSPVWRPLSLRTRTPPSSTAGLGRAGRDEPTGRPRDTDAHTPTVRRAIGRLNRRTEPSTPGRPAVTPQEGTEDVTRRRRSTDRAGTLGGYGGNEPPETGRETPVARVASESTISTRGETVIATHGRARRHRPEGLLRVLTTAPGLAAAPFATTGPRGERGQRRTSTEFRVVQTGERWTAERSVADEPERGQRPPTSEDRPTPPFVVDRGGRARDRAVPTPTAPRAEAASTARSVSTTRDDTRGSRDARTRSTTGGRASSGEPTSESGAPGRAPIVSPVTRTSPTAARSRLRLVPVGSDSTVLRTGALRTTSGESADDGAERGTVRHADRGDDPAAFRGSPWPAATRSIRLPERRDAGPTDASSLAGVESGSVRDTDTRRGATATAPVTLTVRRTATGTAGSGGRSAGDTFTATSARTESHTLGATRDGSHRPSVSGNGSVHESTGRARPDGPRDGAPWPAQDMDRFVDRVYGELQRKFRIERERRGL